MFVKFHSICSNVICSNVVATYRRTREQRSKNRGTLSLSLSLPVSPSPPLPPSTGTCLQRPSSCAAGGRELAQKKLFHHRVKVHGQQLRGFFANPPWWKWLLSSCEESETLGRARARGPGLFREMVRDAGSRCSEPCERTASSSEREEDGSSGGSSSAFCTVSKKKLTHY